ncbi:MAG: hypothetical protein IJG23_04735 [Clostridia bacterium]|nr:hypothetical protein [Clostridia bacterium]
MLICQYANGLINSCLSASADKQEFTRRTIYTFQINADESDYQALVSEKLGAITDILE